MKKRTNIKIAFIIYTLLSLAFMLSGLGFFAGNAFAKKKNASEKCEILESIIEKLNFNGKNML